MPIFERFLRYAWAEHALDLAVQGGSPAALHPWLTEQGLGSESAHRTANILTWLWYPRQPQAGRLRDEALALYPRLSLSDHLVLHWGMAICVFPSFRQSAQAVGRLSRLQGYFYKADIVSRVLEKYSNQSTLKRAVERAIQTFADWGVIEGQASPRYTARPALPVSDSVLAAWLFRALLSAEPERYWRLDDLQRAAELFPFEVAHALSLLYADPHTTVHRDAAGEEIVGLVNP